MLKAMRNNLKSLSITLWLVIFAFIGTTFLVWGWRSTSGGGRGAIVARVGGEPISLEEYQWTYSEYYRLYQKIYGEKFDEKVLDEINLKEKVLQEVIDRHLVLQEARKKGFSISPQELARHIKGYPAFLEKGVFSRDRYLKVLSLNRLTPEKFEESLREDLLYQKMVNLIKGSAFVSEEEAKQAYLMAREKVKVEYVALPLGEKERAEGLYKRIKGREAWARVMAEEKLSSVITDFFSYGAPLKDVPEAGSFSRAAFSLGKGEVSEPVQGGKGIYIIRLLERKPASEKEYEKEREAWRRQFYVIKREQLFQSWLEGMRSSVKIQIEKEFL